VLFATGAIARADDWPGFRGPHGDGVSRETGLAAKWPAEGPKQLWKVDLPGGFSSVAVVGPMVYTQSKRGGDELVLAFGREGNLVWEFSYPVDYKSHSHSKARFTPGERTTTTMDPRFQSGPRATPTIAGGKVYAVGTLGNLHCLDALTGKVVWSVDLFKEFGGLLPEFGYAHSPVVEGKLLLVQPAGRTGKSVAALDKDTGKTVWAALDDIAGYGSTVPLTRGGGPSAEFAVITGKRLVVLETATGRLRWDFPWQTDYDMNVATPIAADGKVFVSSGYGKGCALVAPPAGDGARGTAVYQGTMMFSHFHTAALYRGHLYGGSQQILKCVELATGKEKWAARGFGHPAVTIADGKLFIQGDRGDVAIAEATPEGYRELGRFKPLAGTCWSAPVVANGRLYVRNERTLAAFDVGGK
jgi:outer membrane protein assembly factor BamB